ncbi:MAG: riboflavin synthase [Bacteroidetes bacterium]|jgi:riboflavin synthase|nr:riboflavin synthase [Bacteroidota bacterium]
MFTGLVEEAGCVRRMLRRRGGVTFEIEGRITLKGLAIDHSIAVDGVCLTVVKRTRGAFVVQAVEETLRKTTLGGLQVGDHVNLERPLLPNSRLGGHFVLGHVDGMGKVISKEVRGSSWHYWIHIPKGFAQHLIPVGSIAVDGISLTMAEVSSQAFAVSIIPHTMEVTTVDRWRPGAKVNLEFDVLGKFVEQFLTVRAKDRRKRQG